MKIIRVKKKEKRVFNYCCQSVLDNAMSNEKFVCSKDDVQNANLRYPSKAIHIPVYNFLAQDKLHEKYTTQQKLSE